MKIIVDGNNITKVVESVTWSGDTRQVARTLRFTIIRDRGNKNIPKYKISEGSKVKLKTDKGKVFFFGIVFEIDKVSSTKKFTYMAYDLMYYINQSEVNGIYKGTPESITKKILSELGVDPGDLAETGVTIKMPCFGKKAYEAIMMAYTAASKKNGKVYMPMITDKTKVSVVEKGKLCGVVLKPSKNLTETTYKLSLTGLVSRVRITDKNNKVVNTVEDAESIEKYGLVQKIVKQEDGEDATIEAKGLLHTTDESATVTSCPQYFRARAGFSVVVKDKETGLSGKYYIESDTHTFSSGKSEMSLTLAFENLMDEKDIEEDKEDE